MIFNQDAIRVDKRNDRIAVEVVHANRFDNERIGTCAGKISMIVDIIRHANRYDFIDVKIFMPINFRAVDVFDDGRHCSFKPQAAAVDD